jgi:hypothetical protein
LGSFGKIHAHHGSAPHFDSDDVVNLDGTVTQLNFVNPRSFVHLEVGEADGSTAEWRCELSGASQLRRFGWSRNTLLRDYVVTDPLYLAEPYRGRDVAGLAAVAYQSFDCVDLSGENNRRSD